MAFGNRARFIRTYRFGGGAPVTRLPTDGVEIAAAEMRRRNALWNALVQIEHEHDQRRYDQLCMLAAEWPDIAEGKEYRAERQVVYRRPEVKTLLAALEPARRAAARGAKQASGLYWCNADEVLKNYEQARQRVLGLRGKPALWPHGTPPALQFHTWHRQTGRLLVRWQHGLPVAQLLSGGDSRLRVSPLEAAHGSGTSRGAQRTTVALRCDRAGGVVVLPVVLHRPLSPEGLVRQAAISRERLGQHERWCLTLAVEEPAPIARHGGATLAVDLCWRQVEGGVRVALAADTDGRQSACILPEPWLNEYAVSEQIQSWRDRDRDALFARFPALAGGEQRARWSPDRLARYARALRDPEALAAAALSADAATALADWYRRDQHHAERQAHLRDQLLGQRLHRYREWAAALVCRADRIVFEDFDLRSFAVRTEAGTAADGSVQRATDLRYQRSRAAPHVLRLAVESAAAHAGVATVRVDPAYTTQRCAACGVVDAETDYAATLCVRCPACGVAEDQDRRACRNLLAAAP